MTGGESPRRFRFFGASDQTVEALVSDLRRPVSERRLPTSLLGKVAFALAVVVLLTAFALLG